MKKKIFSVIVAIILTVAFNCATFRALAGEKNPKAKMEAVVDSTMQKLSRTQVIGSLNSQIADILREEAVINANMRIARLQGQIDLLKAMKEDSITVPKAGGAK